MKLFHLEDVMYRLRFHREEFREYLTDQQIEKALNKWASFPTKEDCICEPKEIDWDSLNSEIPEELQCMIIHEKLRRAQGR